MNLQTYLAKMKNIQTSVLRYVENDNDSTKNFQILHLILDKSKIGENKHELTSLLYLLLNIANNHYQNPHFFSKIEQILLKYENQIKQNFTNKEIFNIFRKSKRLTLFLFDRQIIKMDKYILKKICPMTQSNKHDFCPYFLPEVMNYTNESQIYLDLYKNVTINDQYYKLRKIGENDNTICELIRKDSLDDFISYVKNNNISLISDIPSSIYEINPFLYSQNCTLFQYATFYNSSKIMNYLMSNTAVEYDSKLCEFSIHGNNQNLISNTSFNHNWQDLYLEAIKCHNNNLALSIKKNHFLNENSFPSKFYNTILKFYNFAFINDDYENLFFLASKYDYYVLVNELPKNNIDINKKILLKI